jgi:hypothetical protein
VAKVSKVLSMDFNLSVACVRTAGRSDGVYLRSFVIEVRNSRRPEIIFKRNPQVNEARSVILGSNAFNLTGRSEYPLCLYPAKITVDIAGVFEARPS